MMRQTQKYIAIASFLSGSMFFLPVYGQTVGTCDRGTASADLDVNNVRARLFNNGNLFRDGSESVYEVPKGSGVNSMHTANIWIGGLDLNGDLRFAGSTYGPFEYWPGPLGSNGQPPDDCSEFDHMFVVYRSDIESYDRNGVATSDIRNWPYELGAPVEDGDGNLENYNLEGGDRPAMMGDQMIWWVMNDVGAVKEWSFTEPIGLEVQVLAYAHKDSTALDNTTFYRYRFTGKGDEPLSNVYFGFFSDAELGGGADDYMGSDSTLDLGFIYNGRNIDRWDTDSTKAAYFEKPPALGIDILGNSGIFENLPRLTKFVTAEPSASIYDPHGNSDDPYNLLRGIWRDNTPMTFGGTGFGGSVPASFMFSGNPAKREYWSEENTDTALSRNVPGDRVILLSSGPFELHPGDVHDVSLAIIWSQSNHRLASYAKLIEDAIYVQGRYDLGFDKMDIIDPPVLNATAEDQSVTLHWENLAGSNNEGNNYSTTSAFLRDDAATDRSYLFEGYQLIEFDGPYDSTGVVIHTYDVGNNLAVIIDERYNHEKLGYVTSVVINGENKGVPSEHVVGNLTSYRDYYYGIRAYAYNENSLPKVIFSDVERITVTPGVVDDMLSPTERLEQIGISPNPYKGRSIYEVNEGAAVVRFTNVPEVADIKVYTLSGTLVREIEKNNNLSYVEWDLTTDEGKQLGSGLYLIHVTVPGVGERVIKFGHVGREI